MLKTDLLSLRDFLKFSRTRRATLYHYDKLDLLPPVVRRSTGYRFYSQGQLALVNVIRALRELGMSLSEIKKRVDNRTPAKADAMLRHQILKIDAEIEQWNRARKLLLAMRQTIQSVHGIDERTITVQNFPAERIVLGELNDYSQGADDYDVLPVFYNTMSEKYPALDLNFPVWGLFSQERIKRGDWKWPSRYYFFNPDGNDERPAGLYAVGYTRGGYGQGGALYERMMKYINENKYEICGNAYEEYPLNELCISDDKNYLIRVMIRVRKRKSRV